MSWSSSGCGDGVVAFWSVSASAIDDVVAESVYVED